jgi:hypothetical protein
VGLARRRQRNPHRPCDLAAPLAIEVSGIGGTTASIARDYDTEEQRHSADVM